MFAKPRVKKLPVPPPKKRKVEHAVAEISFDTDARADYLTGFHKRKQARIKHAQKVAAEKARQEKIEMRKQIREDRKREVEEHVEQVNAMLQVAQNAGIEESGDAEGEGWGGFTDEATKELEPVDLEAEYVDEDRFTTVTIESVNIDRDGLHRPEEEAKEGDPSSEGEGEEDGGRGREAKDGGKAAKPPRPKKQRKKFRYESKAERRITERKNRSKR